MGNLPRKAPTSRPPSDPNMTIPPVLAPPKRPHFAPSLVSRDRGFRETRNVAKGNAHGIRNRFRQTAQSGAQYDPDLRLLLGGVFANGRGSLDCRLRREFRFHGSGPISCSILSETSSISMSRSSQ